MFPAVRNKKTCLQLWQACAPWGSFVFDRAPFGFWSTNSLLVDPFGGSSWCNMSPASTKQKYLFCLWQACAPWGSFVFERAPFGSWSTNSLHVDSFGGCPAGASCLEHLQTKLFAYSYERVVTHGAHLSLKEPQFVPGERSHSMLIRFGGVQQVQHVSSN